MIVRQASARPPAGRLPAERGLDRRARDPTARKHRRLGAGPSEHAQLLRRRELEPERGLVDGGRRVEVLGVGGDLGQAHGLAAGEDHLAAGVDVDRDLTAEHLQVAEALIDVHVRDPEALGPIDAPCRLTQSGSR